MISSNLFSNFYKLTREERIQRMANFCTLSQEEAKILIEQPGLSEEILEHLIENSVGTFPIPMGVVSYFKMDDRSFFVPMAVEETSILAAASATAKWVFQEGSLETWMESHDVIGQIQFPLVEEPLKLKALIAEHTQELLAKANETVPGLIARGGGFHRLEIRELSIPPHFKEMAHTVYARAGAQAKMMVLHLLAHPCDAMGANLVNQAMEALKPFLEDLTEQAVGLCILSNLVDTKLVAAKVHFAELDQELAQGIESASLFAEADPYRAVTHNKGILNGIDPILIATGNDWRAVEAGAHAFAARSGITRPLSTWRRQGKGLIGHIQLPMAVGIVGGVTKLHPTAKLALKILGVQSSEELSRICAGMGLIQNLGALKALSTVGIVQGHMQLHAGNLAIASGAQSQEIPIVREKIIELLRKKKFIHLSQAQEVLEELRKNSCK